MRDSAQALGPDIVDMSPRYPLQIDLDQSVGMNVLCLLNVDDSTIKCGEHAV